MNLKGLNISRRKVGKALLCVSLVFAAAALLSCAGADPRKVDVELETTPPEAKVTSYTEALGQLGLMTEIYGTQVLKIQSNPIGDVTGTSMSTGGEIPRDITEMVKSSLNSIGGNVVFIPYDPAFIQNQMVTGYSNFENKVIPDVILSGGITEFDRGLVTRGENTDVSAGTEIKGVPEALPSGDVKLRYGGSGKQGLARITLDFNLLDFETMTGIPKMNTVNTMEVHKAVAGKELGISLFGQTFGLKGSVKKVQGRHDAVRLLVELSMIEIVGKHLALPYWRLLGDDARPDKVVMDAISRYYYSLTQPDVVASVQEWLYLYGYDVPISGVLDETTAAALKEVYPSFDPSTGVIDEDTFTYVYVNIPVDNQTLARRQMLTSLYQQQAEQAVEDAPAQIEEQAQAVEPQQQPPAEAEAVEQVQQEAPAQPAVKPGAIGRILTDEEW
jgi:hypothetical protein